MQNTDTGRLEVTDLADFHSESGRYSSWWKNTKLLWEPPEPALLHASARGEIVFALIRLIVIALLTVIPVRNLLAEPGDFEHVIGLSVALTAGVLSLLVYLLLIGGYFRPWVGMATSLMDVSLVSGALLSFLIIGNPHTAVNSKVVFPCYFLALGATCLRYDPRISMTAGLAAFTQYLAIVSYADWNWSLNDPRYSPFTMGVFSWNAQIGRFILLLSAFVLNTSIVARNKYLLLLSCHDPLTGLLNRREFDHRLRVEANRALRNRRPLAIAMVDIDDFKQLNDTLGHRSGDRALQIVGRMLLASVRREDLVARFGGDEFIVLFPETEPEEARAILSRIEQKIDSRSLEDNGRKLRISSGVAGWPADGSTIDAVFHSADRRLYQAKRDKKTLTPEQSP